MRSEAISIRWGRNEHAREIDCTHQRSFSSVKIEPWNARLRVFFSKPKIFIAMSCRMMDPSSNMSSSVSNDTIYLCNFRVSVDGDWLCLKELHDLQTSEFPPRSLFLRPEEYGILSSVHQFEWRCIFRSMSYLHITTSNNNNPTKNIFLVCRTWSGSSWANQFS